jgi:hypothetical protein
MPPTLSDRRTCHRPLPLPLALAALLLVAASPAAGGVHEVPVAPGPVEVDGRLDEPSWQQAVRIELDVETYPATNTPAPVRTVCLVLHDGERLLVGFRAEDRDVGTIRAHLTDRDDAHRNDLVGFVLDTFGDERRGYFFMVNPLGVQMDGRASGLGSSAGSGLYPTLSGAPEERFAWDAIWSAATRLTAGGYEAEIAVPFASLRFPASGSPRAWGFAPFRSWPRVDRRRFQSFPIDRDESCYLCQAEKLTGLSGIEPSRDIEIDPTVTWARSDVREQLDADDLERGPGDFEGGVTGRWGITPSLSLSGTINPDFSQVAADTARIDLNRRFALFFGEKRPFFLEGADRFDTPERVIYTRTLDDPAWGLKLTGREGRHAVGAYVAENEGTGLLFPGVDGSRSTRLPGLDHQAGVVRYRHDLGRASTVGLLLTERRAEDYGNRVYGLDGQLRLSSVDVLTVQGLRSRTHYPEEVAADFGQPPDTFTGTLARVRVDRNARRWQGYVDYRRLTPGFRADSGFITRVGTRRFGAGLQRSFWSPPWPLLSRIRVGLDAARLDDHQGTMRDENVGLRLELNGPLQSFLRARYRPGSERFGGQVFDDDRFNLFFNIRPSGALTWSVGLAGGDDIDYAGGRAARSYSIRPGLTYNLGRHLYLQLDHAREVLELPAGQLFRASVTEAHIVYQFTLRAFLRAIVQHESARRDLSLYACDEGDCPPASDSSVYSQLLFSYTVNPRTLLYFGYSELRREEPHVDLSLERRSLFVKIGYAWLL